MLSDVKKVSLELLNTELETLKQQEAALRQDLAAAQSQLWDLENELSRGASGKKKFTLMEKLLTQRQRYHKFRAQQKRLAALPDLITAAQQEVERMTVVTDERIAASGLPEQFAALRTKEHQIESAQTLYEIGLTPAEAVTLLQERDIVPVLTEEDKTIFEHPRNFQDKSSLIGVHKTNWVPENNQILTASDAHVQCQREVTINGQVYPYQFDMVRHTVHMSVNDEVSSHAYGDWENCQYAVLTPFASLPNEKIARGAPQDTFTNGSVDLGNDAWILCPADQVAAVQAKNPAVNVIGYDGANVTGYASSFLTQLGYRAERVNAWGWDDATSAQQFNQIMAQENIKLGTHSFTHFAEDEDVLTGINQAVALAEMLRDQRLITKPEDLATVMPQLSAGPLNQTFGIILDRMVGTTDCPDDIDATAIKGNNRQWDYFFDAMAQHGLPIDEDFQQMIRARFQPEGTAIITSESAKNLLQQFATTPFNVMITAAVGTAILDEKIQTIDQNVGQIANQPAPEREVLW